MGLITIGGLAIERPVNLRGVALEACVDRHGNVIWRFDAGGDEPGGGGGDEPETVFIPYTFAAISDVHYGNGCANENERFTSWCSYIVSHMPNLILATGDLSNATNYKATSGVNHPRTALQAAGIPYTFGADDNVFHWAWGNHENNSTDTLDTLCAAFDATMGAGASQTNWFDFQGDRFIMMHFRNMSSKRAQFTVDDLTALQSALNTAGERRVFLIQHCPDFTRTICGASGKGDTTHMGYDAPDIAWEGETLDVREIFRRIVDAHVAAHPGKLIWLHGHTHKQVPDGDNRDDTYFSKKGWTVHVPSLGRPYVKNSGEDKTFGEWAIFTVNRNSVSVSYRRVNGNAVTDGTVVSLDAYGFDIPCAGVGVPAEDGGTWVVRLVGGELYVDEAPTACVRMDGNDIILEDAG